MPLIGEQRDPKTGHWHTTVRLEVAVVGLRPPGYEQNEPTATWDDSRVWITPDVNVPDALLAAQRDDRLVIFAGAGVSVDPPSDLPLFKSLARRIGEDAGASPSSTAVLCRPLGRSRG